MPRRGEGKMVEVEGYGPASIRDLSLRVFPEMNKSYKFFQHRLEVAGWPTVVTKELFESSKPRRPKKGKVAGASFEKINLPPQELPKCTQRFADPSYLPEVPWGDLEHLSDELNTGAARVGV